MVLVVGAAIVRDGACLVARRSEVMREPGRWEFPGGKVEPGETPQAALEREIFEELGVRIRTGAFIGRGRAERDGITIVLDVYAATLVEGEPSAREHAELAWVEGGRLSALEWAEADVPIVGKLAKLLNNQ